jgi:hypothetical protein
VAFVPDRAYFIDADAVAVLTAENTEIPAGQYTNGKNLGALAVIGIGADYPDLSGLPNQYTLLDQAGATRTPQLSQAIGGIGLEGGVQGPATQPVQFGVNYTQSEIDADPSLKGGVSETSLAWLIELEIGWQNGTEVEFIISETTGWLAGGYWTSNAAWPA